MTVLVTQFIESIYNGKLLHLDKENFKKRYEGKEDWLGMSSAGKCFKQLQYKADPLIKGSPKDAKSMRVLRLGTVVGDDIQDALEKANIDQVEPGAIVFIEHHVSLEEYHVRGHLDFAVYHPDGTLEVVDFKTANHFSWSFKFGKKPEKSNGMYEMQVTSYGIALKRQLEADGHEVKEVLQALYYYNKDNSMLKQKPVPFTKWENQTLMYWKQAWEYVRTKAKLEPGMDDGVPNSLTIRNGKSWECSYCDFSMNPCHSPLLK